ncbi:alpha/beta fold hydrolase [Paractinoplanes brasiliensis]|uniref:Pimeloyl-ACP methyl ester carboxylesterase n=1 Tax=Paractinoplanes brasiliensis TaxID=52695 RepID=A0A4R6J8J8_9ACTN|nr:alpha/beta fold hydrolase [Actinoplanes brasiliensis]TDO31211.1 pimeloyl-ACP methyl ester carboxylesterase [Actinoplanes brasiliensis]GID28473.1 alpha/beta hydrolase [Actinoplanes brasiliensis]
MSAASVNGITIDYDDTGAGRPLVLVHGHPFDRSMWRPQVEALAGSGWRVITADLRGYGATTVIPGKTPLPVFARDVAGLADHLGIGDFVLGGLSMGGQIVMECYRQFPSRVRALILADTFPRADTGEAQEFRRATAGRIEAEGMTGYAEQNLSKMLAARNVDAMPAVAGHVMTMMTSAPPAGAAAALRGRAERDDYRKLLTTVAVPTLVVVGRDDEFTPVADAEEMHALIPGARLVVVDHAGHLPNLEQPAAFNDALTAFLASL